MPDSLAAFLAARLDEETETARAAERARTERDLRATSPWIAAGSLLLARQADGVHLDVAEVVDYQLDAVLEHAARQDPQTALDRVEALRAVVATHRPVERDLAGVDVCSTCADFDTDDEGEFAGRDEEWPCPTLRALAYAYRRQPGWLEEWAPDGVEATDGAR